MTRDQPVPKASLAKPADDSATVAADKAPVAPDGPGPEATPAGDKRPQRPRRHGEDVGDDDTPAPATGATGRHDKNRDSKAQGRAEQTASDGQPTSDAAGQSDDNAGDEGRAKRGHWRRQRQHSEYQEEEAKRMAREAKQLIKQARRNRRRALLRQRHRTDVEQMAPELAIDMDRPVLELPETPDHVEVTSEEFLRDGNARRRLLRDRDTGSYSYEVTEPVLSRTEQEAYDFLHDTLLRLLPARPPENLSAKELLLERLDEAVTDHQVMIDDTGLERIRYHIIRDLLGYGRIDLLMEDPEIEDISCDGPGLPVFLVHRRHASVVTNVVFDNEMALDRFVIRLAQRSGKHISIADPLLDATLPDGSRLQATLSREVTTRGSSFTIRRFRDEPMTPPELVQSGTWSPEMAAWFWFLMEEGGSLLLAGGTASGKTTTLNGICQFIPPERKVVTIEDTREINLRHENWIAGVTRSGFGGSRSDGHRAGAVDMYDLLSAALRQRPEHLLVGEVRGEEALTLFQAMATGHAVASTMHADSVASAVYRLENDPINVPRLMLQTLDVVAIQRQVRHGSRIVRRVTDVTEIVGFDPHSGDLLTNVVFTWDGNDDEHRYRGSSKVLRLYQERMGLDDDALQAEWDRRVEMLRLLIEDNRTEFASVAKHLHHYYQDAAGALARLAGMARAAPEGPWGQRSHAQAIEPSPLHDLTPADPSDPEALGIAADHIERLPAADAPGDHDAVDAILAPAPPELVQDTRPEIALSGDDDDDEAPSDADAPAPTEPSGAAALAGVAPPPGSNGAHAIDADGDTASPLHPTPPAPLTPHVTDEPADAGGAAKPSKPARAKTPKRHAIAPPAPPAPLKAHDAADAPGADGAVADADADDEGDADHA